VLDHNYNLWGRAICTLDNPAVKKYSNAVAWHGYVGSPEMMQKVHDVHPDAQMFWTEGGPDYTDPKYLTDWSKWSETFTGILRNWCQSVIGWNLALDEQGRPNIGPFPCGGLVTIHSQTKQITESGQYWAMSHWSRKVKRGARRIESQSALKDVHHAAFENASGERVLMITNPGAARSVDVRLGRMQAKVDLPADSIVSISWS
jgi:glucosylceramidase